MQLPFDVLDRVATTLAVEIGIYPSTRTPMKNTRCFLPQNLARSCPSSSSSISHPDSKSFTGRYVEHPLAGVHSLEQIAFAASKMNTATIFFLPLVPSIPGP